MANKLLDSSLNDLFKSARSLANKAAEQAKPTAKRAWNYAKENPAEIILGIVAMDIASSLDNIEELEQVQTYISVDEYMDR